MKTVATIESLDSFTQRSAKDWEMKTRLSTFLNSVINIEVLTLRDAEEVKEIAEHFDLQSTIEKLKSLSEV